MLDRVQGAQSPPRAYQPITVKQLGSTMKDKHKNKLSPTSSMASEGLSAMTSPIIFEKASVRKSNASKGFTHESR